MSDAACRPIESTIPSQGEAHRMDARVWSALLSDDKERIAATLGCGLSNVYARVQEIPRDIARWIPLQSGGADRW
jgi:hypothetical protein